MKKRQAWFKPYLKMSKPQLLAILDPEMGIEETLRLARLSKLALAHRIRRAVRTQERESRKPCPKGHKPGDPACSLDCYVVVVDPIETPFLTALPKVKAAETYHAWVTDELKPLPVEKARERMIGIFATTPGTQEALRQLMNSAAYMRSPYLEALGRMYRDLDHQFAVPKRHWWERLPYTWGWWWRVPYGWWLKLDRALTPRRWR